MAMVLLATVSLVGLFKCACYLGAGFVTLDSEREKELPNCCVPQLATRFQRHPDHVYHDLSK